MDNLISMDFQQLYIGDSDGYAVRIACGSTSLDTSNLITGGVKEYRNHGHVYGYIDLFLDDPLYFIYPWLVQQCVELIISSKM